MLLLNTKQAVEGVGWWEMSSYDVCDDVLGIRGQNQIISIGFLFFMFSMLFPPVTGGVHVLHLIYGLLVVNTSLKYL